MTGVLRRTHRLRLVLAMGYLALATPFCVGLLAFALPLELLGVPAAHAICRLWARGLCLAAGIRVFAEGTERLQGVRGAVIAANHRSHLDSAALLVGLPIPLVFLGKRSLFRIPVFGWGLHLAGHIPVDRGQREKARDQVEGAATAVRAGRNLLVFPEGTRAKEEALLPFKKGGFVIAVQAGVPIYPVSITGSRDCLPAGTLALQPGTITVRVLEPIATDGMGIADRDRLAGLTREAIVHGLGEAGACD